MTPEQRIAQLTKTHARSCAVCDARRFTRPVRQFPGGTLWVEFEECLWCRLGHRDSRDSTLATSLIHHRRAEVRAWARIAEEFR